MRTFLKAREYMIRIGQSADCIDARFAEEKVKQEIREGLEGTGGLPMLPSYVSACRFAPEERIAVVIDVGGTSLRRADAKICSDGKILLSNIRTMPVPGTETEITSDMFFGTVAEFAAVDKGIHEVGVSFSYGTASVPGPDVVVAEWCKELKVSEIRETSVAASIKKALGRDDLRVSVINDSVAASLAAGFTGDKDSRNLGVIVGTGFNICCPFPIASISKLKDKVNYKEMVVNTEVGASDAFEKGEIDKIIIEKSADPEDFHAEKQCSGKYLQSVIQLSLKRAEEEALICGRYSGLNLMEMGRLIEEAEGDDERMAAAIITEAERRSAKIAAICTSALLGYDGGNSKAANILTEGSVINKMPGYLKMYEEELSALCKGGLSFSKQDNPCLLGAAKAIC